MKRKEITGWIKAIGLSALTIGTGLTISTLYFMTNPPTQQTKESDIIEIKDELDTKEVKLTQSSIKLLEDSLKKTSNLVVLNGKVNTSSTYLDKDTIPKDEGLLYTLKEWFNKSRARSITIEAQYNFSFSYDISKLECVERDGYIEIYVNRANLQLESLELDESNTKYHSDLGWLSDGDFAPNELNCINEINKMNVENTIRNVGKIREYASAYLEQALIEMGRNLEVDVVVTFSGFDATYNGEEEVEISGIEIQ